MKYLIFTALFLSSVFCTAQLIPIGETKINTFSYKKADGTQLKDRTITGTLTVKEVNNKLYLLIDASDLPDGGFFFKIASLIEKSKEGGITFYFVETYDSAMGYKNWLISYKYGVLKGALLIEDNGALMNWFRK